MKAPLGKLPIGVTNPFVRSPHHAPAISKRDLALRVNAARHTMQVRGMPVSMTSAVPLCRRRWRLSGVGRQICMRPGWSRFQDDRPGTDRHIEHHHTPVRRSSSPCTTCTDLSKSRWEYPCRPPGVNRSVFPSNLLGEYRVNPPGGVLDLGEATLQQERSVADRCLANQLCHAGDGGQRVRDLPVDANLA